MRVPSDRTIGLLRKGSGTSDVEVPVALQDLPLEPGFLEALLLLEEVKKRHGWQARISRIHRFPDEPHLKSFMLTGSEVGSGGYDLSSETLAFRRAVSEFIERKAWYQEGSAGMSMTSAELKESGFPIGELAGFSQEERNRIPGLAFSDESTFIVKRLSSLQGGKAYCPVQLFAARKEGARINEPLLQETTSNGLATSWVSREDALLRGLLELIERDAFMIAYTNRLSPPQVAVPDGGYGSEALTRALDEVRRLNLDATFLLLPTDFPVFVCLAVVRDMTGKGPAVTIGARADFSLEHALEAALVEALAGRTWLRVDETWKRPAKDPGEVRTISERVLLWAKPEQLPRIDFLLSGPKVQAPQESKTGSRKEQLRTLISSLKEKGYWGAYYEYHLSLSSRFPLHVVRAIVPELQPIYLGSTASYEVSGKRMQEVPKALGYEVPSEPNTFPHPFP